MRKTQQVAVFPEDRLALTLTELWWDAGKQNILTLNGFSGSGSQYEVFRNLCRSLDRMPDLPEAEQSREQLRAWFGCQLPLTTAHCGTIWRQTAEWLIEHPTCRKDLPEIPLRENSAPQRSVFSEAIFREWRVEQNLPPEKSTWKEWSAHATEMLNAQCGADIRFSLTLPADFVPQKPSLYHVERILNREGNNRDLWLSQLAFFLLAYCEQRGVRPLFRSECPPEQLHDLLLQVSGMTALPELEWMPDTAVSRQVLCDISRMVIHGRGNKREGSVPVLLREYRKAEI